MQLISVKEILEHHPLFNVNACSIILSLLYFTAGVRGPITLLHWLMLRLRDMHWNVNRIDSFHAAHVDPSAYRLCAVD